MELKTDGIRQFEGDFEVEVEAPVCLQKINLLRRVREVLRRALIRVELPERRPLSVRAKYIVGLDQDPRSTVETSL